jgi:hypothetical protein
MPSYKKINNWIIALIHFFYAAIVFILIGSTIGIFCYYLIINLIIHSSFTTPEPLVFIILFIIISLILLVAIIYSSQKINKNYFIVDNKKIALMSTGYNILTGVIVELYYGSKFINTYNIIGFLIVITVYYLASLKYIKLNNQ